ncbi:CotH kinase family protein [Lacihabitans soyangensis]|uniref:Spore coat protein CotH n=1 Tax=Lacihabitans soyangensis TaxID=869394 RepID=A0AAE3H0B9_9BACT|nr:CotH kinase family protein [Lacihabitans soyangensis]MCP9761701.1 spore coat protein CotH [Lacihabitans soyangensis]
MRISKLLIFFIFFFQLAHAQLSRSKLPIFVINTKGQTIKDEPKILAELKVIYNGEGKENQLTDTQFHYNSFVGIEYRGSSSQMFPKKGLGIELRTEKGENNPLALCGLPEDADWILYASYNEKSLMHNVLSMSLARQMGMNASRTKYVEVVIDNLYQGVYVLMEKIKVDKNRVNIATLKPEDIAGDELTGGYIVKIDKSTGTNYGTFRSNYTNANGFANQYYYHLPKTINDAQRNYIRAYIRKFEDAIYGKDYKDELNGYAQYVDLSSFAKMFIINEVSRNIDGYRISSYFTKDKDSKGGKLTASPPWDYDISYGNADYCQGSRYDLWAYKFNEICPRDGFQVPVFWERMVSDPKFIGELRNIYFEQRKAGGVLDHDRIVKEIDELKSNLGEAAVRNFQKWPIIGTYVWPSPQPVPATWDLEIVELKNWIYNRLVWMDRNFPEEFVLTSNELPSESLNVTAFPNPFVDKLQVKILSQNVQKAEVSFSDITGRIILKKDIELSAGENFVDFDQIQNVNDFLFLKVKTESGVMNFRKVVRVN